MKKNFLNQLFEIKFKNLIGIIVKFQNQFKKFISYYDICEINILSEKFSANKFVVDVFKQEFIYYIKKNYV